MFVQMRWMNGKIRPKMTQSPTRFQLWLGAFRLRTLPLAAASILLGGLLAAGNSEGRPVVVVLALLTALLLQILSNLANDYGDFVHGADAERQGPTRYVQAGLISKRQMQRAILICGLLSAVAGLTLVIVALGVARLPLLLGFVVLGGAAMAAAYNYTAGRNPYGYVGLGDIFVLIFFGWVGTLGTYFLQALRLDWTLLLPATAIGLLSVAVLNINNIRDIETDKAAGKITIPVRLGPFGARIYHWGLLVTALACAVIFTVLNIRHPIQLIFVLSAPLIVRSGVAVLNGTTPQEVAPQLKVMSQTALLFALLLGLGYWLTTFFW